MRAVLLRSLAVLGVGLVILAAILYYASTVDGRPPLVERVALTQHVTGDDRLALTTTSIEVTFSEPVRVESAEPAFATEPRIEGAFSWSGRTMTFTPAGRLPLETDFVVRLRDGVTDEAGNRMEDTPPAFEFRTVGPPTLAATDPADGAGDVGLDAAIVIEFSSLMDTASVEEALRIRPQIRYEASWSAERLTLTPARQLAGATRYTVSIGSAARDNAGIPLQGPVRFSFTTTRSSLEPTLLVPADGSEGVAIGTSIAVVLDRELDPDADLADAFQIQPELAGSLEIVAPPGAAGLVDPTPRVVRFEPSGALAPNTTYRVTLAGGLAGTDGGELAEPIEWSFTTGAPLTNLSNQIVFLSDRAGVANLWAMNPDGSAQRQLSAELSPVVDYAVAPDGRSFVIGDGAVLVRYAADGSGREVLTPTDLLEFDPAWAPDGSRLAFGRADRETGDGLGIWTRAAEGGDATRIELPDEAGPSGGASPSETADGDAAILRTPRYSPDGSALAFVDLAGQIGIVELAADELVTATWWAAGAPAWTSDSSAILVSGLPDRAAIEAPEPGTPLAPLDPDAASSDVESGTLRLVRIERDGGRIEGLPLPRGAVRPAVGSTGSLLFVAVAGDRDASGALWLVEDLDQPGQRRRLLDDDAPPVLSATFGPEPGAAIVARSAADAPPGGGVGAGIWLVDVGTGRGEQLSRDGHQPRWLP